MRRRSTKAPVPRHALAHPAPRWPAPRVRGPRRGRDADPKLSGRLPARVMVLASAARRPPLRSRDAVLAFPARPGPVRGGRESQWVGQASLGRNACSGEGETPAEPSVGIGGVGLAMRKRRRSHSRERQSFGSAADGSFHPHAASASGAFALHGSFPRSLCWNRERGKRPGPALVSEAQAVAQREQPA